MKLEGTRRAFLGGMLVLTLFASGCNNASVQKAEKLQQENAALKAENEALKLQLQTPAVTATSIGVSSKSFTDIETVPTKGFIKDLAKLGVFEDLETEFNPQQPITRGEFVTWLVKAHNAIKSDSEDLRIDPNSPATFKDLKPAHFSFQYVQALANAGYSVGYQDGTFKPDQPITREEMMAIKTGVDAKKAMEADKGMFIAHSGYTDAKDVDERYMGYIGHAGEFSSSTGTTMQLAFGNIRALKPKQPVLRQEAAGALWQFGGGLGGTATTAGDILKDQSEVSKK